MADDWYYAQGTEQRGPVTWEALQGLARGGQITAESLVWMAGMPQWQPAGSVGGLLSAAGVPMYAPPQAFAAPVSAGLNYFSPAVGQTMYAGFWLRVCACVIDWFVIGLPFYLVGRLFVSPQPVFIPGRPVAFPPDFFMGSCALPLVHLVADWLYYALMESSVRQATLGKLALGLRVTDGAGRPITFGRATGRHFAKYLSALTLGIGYMMAGWTQRKQALHDLVADTLVWRG